MCSWSCISLFKFSSVLSQKHWSNIKVHTNFQSLIDPCLFKLFRGEKIHLVCCNNTCEPTVPFMHNHYNPLMICCQKMLKAKEIETIHQNYHPIKPAT